MNRGVRVAPYKPPTVGSRIGWGSMLAIALFVGYVLVPEALFSELHALGIRPPVGTTDLAIAGIVLTGLGTAQYLLKPTRAYGPVSIAYALTILGYLAWFAMHSPVPLSLPGATVSAGYTSFILVASLVPILVLIGGIASTVEDATEPRERVRIDFPPPVAWR